LYLQGPRLRTLTEFTPSLERSLKAKMSSIKSTQSRPVEVQEAHRITQCRLTVPHLAVKVRHGISFGNLNFTVAANEPLEGFSS